MTISTNNGFPDPAVTGREEFKLVTLREGIRSIKSLRHGETMHVGTDPVTEARELHVFQQRLPQRLAQRLSFPSGPSGVSAECDPSPFVIWDVGMGPAANAIAALDAAESAENPVELHSFEIDTTVLEFALRHARELDYLGGWEEIIRELLAEGMARPFPRVLWKLHRGDFSRMSPTAPSPAAVLFDPYSPLKNPEMWSLPVFRSILEATNPDTPCLLTNYTRSTAVRVTMLLAGWYVGRGVATGEKEETTVASNRLELLESPLGQDWLRRVASSTNSAPLLGGSDRGPISRGDYAKLLDHSQFCSGSPAQR